MRIGTWNLRQYPRPTSPRGLEIQEFLASQAVDIWLLTEVSRAWQVPGQHHACSSARPSMHVEHRLAGVQSSAALEVLTAETDHPGEQGLCLVRTEVDGTSLLVASSVLPWRGAQQWWPGLPQGTAAALRFVLRHHVARIREALRPGEVLLWGGDLNQELRRPFTAGTVPGERSVAEALDELGLTALTVDAEHLSPDYPSIDHLAAPSTWTTVRVDVHRPSGNAGPLSDHAAYTAELLPG